MDISSRTESKRSPTASARLAVAASALFLAIYLSGGSAAEGEEDAAHVATPSFASMPESAPHTPGLSGAEASLDLIDRNASTPLAGFRDLGAASGSSGHGSWFSASGWIWSTNPGPGDWDYTDYVLSWDHRHTAYLSCCQHGVYHMPAADGGMVRFTASRVSQAVVNQHEVYDAATVYHHKVLRSTYYVRVDAGRYQDVDGWWTEDHETVTASPRYGGVDLNKASAAPDVTDGSAGYSTAGAAYGIYGDAACTRLLGAMSTDPSGRASAWGLRAGSAAYVKEYRPSRGYDLDPTTYRVFVTADRWTHVNGGRVREPPKTATVRFYVDGGASPVHAVELPLGTVFEPSDQEVRKASELAAEPNCTPGLSAWHCSASYSSVFTGKALDGDLDLYARNVATVSYAPAAGSPLFEDPPPRKSMSSASPPLDIARNVLPPQRQASWGRRIVLAEPRLKTLYRHDGTRWRTLRWRGWYLNAAATGSPARTLEVTQDTTVFGDWPSSTYDGILSW